MYAIYWLFSVFHWPFVVACVVAIPGVALLGLLVHLLIIEPVLGCRRSTNAGDRRVAVLSAKPCTLLFGTDFRNLGVRLPLLEWGDFSISFARLLAFGAALIGAGVLICFCAAAISERQSAPLRRTARSWG